jgi:hypothetical protein
MSYVIKSLQFIDRFGSPVNLNINSMSSNKTSFGGILSILTFFFFLFIFYKEFDEVYKKDNPIFTFHSDNRNFYNSSTKFTNRSFPFYLSGIDEFISAPEYFKFFKFDIQYLLEYKLDSNDKSTFKYFNITLEPCNQDDEIFFRSFKKNFNFNSKAENYCVRGIENEEIIANYFYKSFSIFIGIYIQKCKQEDSGCLINETLYNQIEEKNIFYTFQLNYFDTRVNLYDYYEPMVYDQQKFQIDVNFDNITSKLGFFSSQEIKTSKDFLFPTKEIMSGYKLDKIKQFYAQNYYAQFMITQIDKCDVYKRNYKSLNSALANSFSVVKVVIMILKFFMKHVCKYLKYNIIINKIFKFKCNEDFFDFKPNSNARIINKSFSDKKIQLRVINHITYFYLFFLKIFYSLFLEKIIIINYK